MNYGQLVLEVERCAAGKCRVISIPHGGGTVHQPEKILQGIEEAYQ
jgi:2-oxoglutarate ferredoxin oxidoreductase subunit alpha